MKRRRPHPAKPAAVDATVIPPSRQQDYAERIVYLPHSFLPHDDARRTISDRPIRRCEFGLPDGGVVFCCFNNAYKFNPRVFQAWMRILKRVSGSVLWFSALDTAAAANLRREAAAAGVDSDRLVFAKRLASSADHLARHRLADLFLDTLPYNSHTTASDALWAGLPVLTQAGETFAGRVAASLLTAIGAPDLITYTQEQYEQLAVELATNPERLAAIRSRIVTNRLASPLFATPLFTRHLEAAYMAMVERYRAGRPPDLWIADPTLQ